jgi:hypothetical protein
MCRNHLLGEHAELHMMVGNIHGGHSVRGYLEKGLLEIHNLYYRHEILAKEMKRRNYKHNSRMDPEWKNAKTEGLIDKVKSLEDLLSRCSKCRMRARMIRG